MELRNLHHIINTHLKENSLAEARFEENVFQDSVIIEHPNNKNASSIVITKSMGCWEIDYEKNKGNGVTIEMKIELTDDNEDINEIVNFINGHTLAETPITQPTQTIEN